MESDCSDRLNTYKKYDEELDALTIQLNSLYKQMKPVHERYEYIMQYFRQQKQRNLITAEEYKMRAERYVGLKKRKGSAQ